MLTDDVVRRAREALGLLAPQERRDEDEEEARRQRVHTWLDVLLRAPVPGRLTLRPDPDQFELRAPPCRECGLELRRVAELSACTACLGVVHRRCWPEGRRCRCMRLALG